MTKIDYLRVRLTFLQNDLTRLEVSCKSNKLLLNFNKCKVVRFSRKADLKIFNYSLIGGTVLDNPDSIRDLGILFSHDLSFAEHFKNVISRAFRSLGLIQRTVRLFNDTNTLRLLYCTLVRRILEYGSLFWSALLQYLHWRPWKTAIQISTFGSLS